jgi:hypothetical protein
VDAQIAGSLTSDIPRTDQRQSLQCLRAGMAHRIVINPVLPLSFAVLGLTVSQSKVWKNCRGV